MTSVPVGPLDPISARVTPSHFDVQLTELGMRLCRSDGSERPNLCTATYRSGRSRAFGLPGAGRWQFAGRTHSLVRATAVSLGCRSEASRRL